MFWKTRWANSEDGSNTPYRTLITYKETHFNGPVDPQDPPTWTGAWADPRFSPPGDGGQPANSLTGQEFLAFIAGMYGLQGEAARRRVAREIDQFELGEFIDELAENYSHGMKQRLLEPLVDLLP